MLVIPAGVLLLFSVYWMGGPTEFLRYVNEFATQGVTWIGTLWSN